MLARLRPRNREPDECRDDQRGGHRDSFLGGGDLEHDPGRPLEDEPAPAPISAPPTRNSARLGVERRTAVTIKATPASIDVTPSASTRGARSFPVASWDSTPEEKTRNSVAPARACEGRSKVVARKIPDRPAKSPVAEKAAMVAAAAVPGCRNGQRCLRVGVRCTGFRSGRQADERGAPSPMKRSRAGGAAGWSTRPERLRRAADPGRQCSPMFRSSERARRTRSVVLKRSSMRVVTAVPAASPTATPVITRPTSKPVVPSRRRSRRPRPSSSPPRRASLRDGRSARRRGARRAR